MEVEQKEIIKIKGSLESNIKLPNDLIFQLIDDKEKGLCLSSIVPGLINIRSDIPIQEMIYNSKFGYNDSVLIPITCVESGMSKLVVLKPGLNILADRPLTLYSWVRQGDNIGFITDIKSRMDLEINGTDFVIKNISENELTSVPEFYPSQYIFYKSWIGCVKSCRHKLHIKFDKGHECWIYDDQQGEQTYRELHLKYPGEMLSLTGADARDAEWIKYPGISDWFLLRYLNLGYSQRSYGKIIENVVCRMTVSWLQSTYIKYKGERNDCPPDEIYCPPDEISEKELVFVEPITLPDKNYFWYGMKGKYKIKYTDKFVDLFEEWKENKLEELLFSNKTNSIVQNPGGGDVLENAKIPNPLLASSKFIPGTEIIGKIILRRATASVLWQNGTTSDVSVIDLVPYHPLENQLLPLSPGIFVRRVESPRSDLNLKYGVVQSSDPVGGFAQIKWLESQDKDTFHITKMWKTKEVLDDLEEHSDFKFPIGLIVILKEERIAGVVVGNDMKGHVLIKMGPVIKKVLPYMLEKLEYVAYSSNFGQIHWQPFREHQKINQKHIMSIPWSTNFGNLISPYNYESNDVVPSSKVMYCSETPEIHEFLDKSQLTPEQIQPFIMELKIHLDHFIQNPLDGIWIRSFKNRPDLLSVLIQGGVKTPFEFGLYHFDIYIPLNYPEVAPMICYINWGQQDCNMELGLPKDGIVNIDDFLEKASKTKDYSLTNVLKILQDTLFSVGIESLHLCDAEASGGIVLPFSSYTRNYSMAAKNQEILRNVLEYMAYLLSGPPSLWEDIILDYSKLQVPRIIARVNKWMFGPSVLHQKYSVSAIEIEAELSENEKPGYLLLPFDPTLHAEIKQAISNLAAAYSKIY